MLKILSSFGASSSFEKHRLILTTDNLEAPDQYSLKKLLQTFHGEDDQTRPQFAFAIITKKILTSEKKESWIYLLKNILILDRVLEDLCFVEQIASLELNTVDNYIETSSKYHEINTSQFIKKCWKLIKYKATLLSSKKHILFFSRSQRAQFLQTLNPPEILQQIQTIEQLFLLSFSIITNFRHYSDTQSLRKSRLSLEKTPLIEYLYLQILYKLISFYSSELLCVNKMLFFITKDSTLNIIPLKLLKKFKASLQKFKQNSSSLINFVQKNKEIKGFEDVNYREFDPILESDLIQKIDLYIDEKVNGNTRENSIQNYVGHSHERISVHLQSKNSLLSNDEISHQPRRKLACKRADGGLNNPFSNWIPNYSEDFPQQQIMTLDLIMILKEENKSGKIEEQILIYPERETFVVEEGIQIGFFRKPSPHDSLKYENLYSSLESVWNS